MPGFLFDFSGTIVDDINATLGAVNDTLGKFATGTKKLSLDEFVDQFQNPLTFLAKHGITSRDAVMRAVQSFEESYSRRVNEIRLFSDVEETLRRVKESNFRTAIVSNTPRSVIQKVLGKTEVNDSFDIIMGFEDCVELKPSPKPVLQAIQRLGDQPRFFAYVGDMDEDVQAAHAAGILSIAIWRERGHYQELNRLTSSNPSFLIERLTEIFSIKWWERATRI